MMAPSPVRVKEDQKGKNRRKGSEKNTTEVEAEICIVSEAGHKYFLKET